MSEQKDLSVQILKYDAKKRLIWGVATAEVPDKIGEVCDYSKSKPHIQAWMEETWGRSDGKSLGNVRAMHPKTDPVSGKVIAVEKEAVGRVRRVMFDDARKWVIVVIEVDADWVWDLIERGVLTGLSFGGMSVGPKWVGEDGNVWYTLRPNEISLVDNPMISLSAIVVMKADGGWDHINLEVEDGGTDMTTNAQPAQPEPQAAPQPITLAPEQLASIVTQVTAGVTEKIEKGFGHAVDERFKGIEAGFETVTQSVARLSGIANGPKSVSVPVQKSADNAPPADPAVHTPQIPQTPVVGDGSGQTPESPIEKGALDNLLTQAFQSPSAPWWLRGVTE